MKTNVKPGTVLLLLWPSFYDFKDKTNPLKMADEKDRGKLLTLSPWVNQPCDHIPPSLSLLNTFFFFLHMNHFKLGRLLIANEMLHECKIKIFPCKLKIKVYDSRWDEIKTVVCDLKHVGGQNREQWGRPSSECVSSSGMWSILLESHLPACDLKER